MADKAKLINIRRGLTPSRVFKNKHTTPKNLAASMDLIVPDNAFGDVEANGKMSQPQYSVSEGQGFTPDATAAEASDDWVVDQNGGTATNTGTLTSVSTTVFQVESGSYATGSELVFVNGILQSEGATEDYTDVPSTGTITLGSATSGNVVVASCPSSTDIVLNVDQSTSGSTVGTLVGTIDGANKVFTTSEPYVSGKLIVILNGLAQFQGSDSDYVETSADAGTFTFDTAPAVGSNITVVSKPQGCGRRYEDTNHTLAGRVDGSNAVYTTTKPFNAGSLFVTLNGLTQSQGASDDYTITGVDEITMNANPASGSVVGVGYEVDGSGGTSVINTRVGTKTVTADTTLTCADYGIFVDTSAGDVTIDLPAVATVSTTTSTIVYRITKTTSDANTVIIDGSGGETIRGATTLVLLYQYTTAVLGSDGDEWFVG